VAESFETDTVHSTALRGHPTKRPSSLPPFFPLSLPPSLPPSFFPSCPFFLLSAFFFSPSPSQDYTTILDINEEVYSWWDHGLLSAAVHPDFPKKPYLFIAVGREREREGAS